MILRWTTLPDQPLHIGSANIVKNYNDLLVVTKSDVTYIMVTCHNLNASYLHFHFLAHQYLYCHADDPT